MRINYSDFCQLRQARLAPHVYVGEDKVEGVLLTSAGIGINEHVMVQIGSEGDCKIAAKGEELVFDMMIVLCVPLDVLQVYRIDLPTDMSKHSREYVVEKFSVDFFVDGEEYKIKK